MTTDTSAVELFSSYIRCAVQRRGLSRRKDDQLVGSKYAILSLEAATLIRQRATILTPAVLFSSPM